LMEKGLVGSILDTHIADAKINVNDLYDSYPHDEWYPLNTKKGKTKGEIHLQIMFLPGSEDAQGEEFTFPLHSLIKKKRLELFKRKIKDLDDVSHKKDGKTALLFVTELGKSKYVEALLDAKIGSPCNVNGEKDNSGKTALHVACKDAPRIVPLLLAHKAKVDIVDETQSKNYAIHYAAMGDSDTAIDLLIKSGADVNAQNETGTTALGVALTEGSIKAIKALVKHKADPYVKNKDGTMVWEISQTEKTEGPARRAFMEAMDAQDPREFMIRKKLKEKTLIKGGALKKDWRECTQFGITVKALTQIRIILFFPTDNRKLEWNKKCGLFVVKSDEGVHKEPSFQQGSIGIGSQKPFKGQFEVDEIYTIVPYTKSEEVEGEFYLIIYSQAGANITYKELVPWKHSASIEGAWSVKKGTAGGCQNNADTWKNNKAYEVTLPQEDDCKYCVLLSQVPDTADSAVLAASEYQVVPYNIHIGFYVFDRGVAKLIRMTKWLGSRDIFEHMTGEAAKRNHIVVIPTTFNPGEESPFRLTVFCDKEVSIKEK